jgi:DNA-binding phage protein
MRSLFFSLLSVLSCWGIYAQQDVASALHQEGAQQNNASEMPAGESSHSVLAEPSVAEQEKTSNQQVSVSPAPPLPKPPVMTDPEKVEAEKAPEIDVEAIDVEKGKGFDTLGLEKPEGNWLIKRIWWEKAEVRYEKIKTLVDQIMDSRMIFFAQRNEVESKILDPFYIQISLTQGQLEEVISFLLDELKRQREAEKGLSPAERQLHETLTAEERTLQQLGLDIEAVRKLDIALDDALTKLMEQINLCRSYEKQAWNAFKDIAKVLDHNKARSLYYSMDTYLSNVKNINNYIQNAFTQHFNSLINTIKQSVDRIKNTMSSLKEKGIDLRQQVKTLEEQESALIKKEEPKSVQPVEQEPEEEEEQGWISWIWTSIVDFFTGIWDLIAFWR